MEIKNVERAVELNNILQNLNKELKVLKSGEVELSSLLVRYPEGRNNWRDLNIKLEVVSPKIKGFVKLLINNEIEEQIEVVTNEMESL